MNANSLFDKDTKKNVFIKLMNIAGIGYYIKHENTGLGNILFQIASGMSYAIKNNAKLNIIDINNYVKMENIDTNNHILRRIDLTIDYNEYNKLINESPITGETYEEYIFNHTFYNNIVFNNHLENYNNFEDIKYLIMYYFSPTKNDISYILSKYQFILDDDICSIHIRLGSDYRTIYDKNYIMELEQNYIKCINHVISVKNIKKFFVFTNDREYSMSFLTNLNLNGIQYFYSNEKDYVDIWMISLIKNNIVSVSTLSWWGSYLNNNKNRYIVCCKGNRDNLHYTDWVVI